MLSASTGALRILPPGMHDADDLDRVRRHPIDENVVRMHHRLAGAVHAAKPIHERVLGQPLRASLDDLLQAIRRCRIALRDIAVDRFEVGQRCLASDERDHASPRPLRSLITARMRAMASSCGTGGRGSASEAATLARSHSS